MASFASFLQLASTAVSAANCQKASSSNLPTPNLVATDCTNPSIAAASLTCLCSDSRSPNFNPSDVRCSQGLAAGAYSASGASSNPSVRAPYFREDESAERTDTILGGPSGNKNSHTMSGGNAGGPQGLIGGGAPMGAEGGGGGALGPDRNIISGLGSGTGSYNYGRGGVTTAPPNGSGYNYGRPRAGRPGDKVNLKSLLPNKKTIATRNVAGMTVQSKDGITGPMGPSIWEKVSTQYQKKQDGLLPP